MRMRKKKHGAERLGRCAEYLAAGRDDLPELPLCLEIGCGKGDFVRGMALRYPEKRFLAVERISDVMLIAVEKAAAAEISPDRVKFAVTDADRLGDILPDGSVSTLYLNFSDPWPKARHAKRRLTHRDRLKRYASFLVPGGDLIFKTDNEALFDFTLGELECSPFRVTYVTRDLHASELAADNVMTEYEKNFSEKGYKIHMLRAVREADNDTKETNR
ncbi:MAG: tRNA (guanosine(46)-N7)-methyltransferase TrmB [Clostridia bacterium]|nr:tRNA (guanosine(46)-N7)-methyltransferase TrmB [Clostridia bacterium]